MNFKNKTRALEHIPCQLTELAVAVRMHSVLTTLTYIELEHAQWRRIMIAIANRMGVVSNYRHAEQKCTICSACEPYSAMGSAQKIVFHRYLLICCAYNTHRCLKLEI